MRYSFWSLGFIAVVLFSGCPGRDNGSIAISGMIEGRTATAGSRIGGRVVAVPAEEGDTIQTGDVLVRLEDTEARVQLDGAQARIAAQEALLAKLEAGATPEQVHQAEAAAKVTAAQLEMVLKGARSEEIRAANAALDSALAQRTVTRKEFDRIANLVREQVAAPSQLDLAQAALDAAAADYQNAMEHRDLVVRGSRDEEIAMARAHHEQTEAALEEIRIGPRVEDIAAARATLDGAIAEGKQAEIALDEMEVRAPQAGIVESLDVRPGDLVMPGPIVRVVDPEDLEVTLFVGAVLLGQLAVGQAVPLTADAYDGESFTGTVRRIAAEGEYTPRNLQTEEERVQQVFGVTLALDTHGGKLRPGMTVTARFSRSDGAP